jgi:thiol-disulfide isomerase/thioredoxin
MRIIILLLCTFFQGVLKSQMHHQSYIINGQFNGSSAGVIQMLSDNGDSVIVESSIINGSFRLSGNLVHSKQMLFRIKPGNWNFKAFVEPGESKIFIDTAESKRYGNATDQFNSWALIWDVEQCCTPMAADYHKFVNETNQKLLRGQIKVIYAKMQVAPNSDSNARYQQLIDSLQQAAISSQKIWVEEFIATAPSTASGPFLLLQLMQIVAEPDWNYFKKWSDLFAGEAKQNYYYRMLQEKLNALSHQQVKQLAPDFSLRKPDHSLFTLSSLKGKYVLLDFWASWCGPCRKEIPAWKKLYHHYQKKGLEIVAISGDRNEKDWRKALAIEGMPWIQVIDSFPSEVRSSIVSDLFGIQLLPHYILLDTNGIVVISSGDAEATRQKIYTFLGNIKQ